MTSPITENEKFKDVRSVTKVTSGGRMYMNPSDFFGLKKVKDTLKYLEESDFFKIASKGNQSQKTT
ncbi:MAG: hypothetical protein AB8F78_00885 [Saprospiraceae bacterium]